MPDWLQTFFNWLQNLSQGQATFLGSFTGAAVGLVAILLGALFNAHLNRRRDDRLRRNEARAAATALRSELNGISRSLMKSADDVERKTFKKDQGVNAPDMSSAIVVLPHALPKIGLLDTATIQAVLDAYAVVEQYSEHMAAIGGKPDPSMPFGRRRIFLPASHASTVAQIDRDTAKWVREAITKLDAFLMR